MERFYLVRASKKNTNLKNNKIKNDVLLICGIILISATWLLFRFFMAENGEELIVYQGSDVYGTYSLRENQKIEIVNQEKKLTNILVIEDGEAYMLSANCPDGLCMKQGKIKNSGDKIICLPNQIIVLIEGKKDLQYDAIAE